MFIHPGLIGIYSALFSNRRRVELLETNSIPDGVSLLHTGEKTQEALRHNGNNLHLDEKGSSKFAVASRMNAETLEPRPTLIVQ